MSAFSLLVIGDTQYLFDGGRQRPELLAETFRHVHRLVEAGAVAPVRHVVHVGDVTEHGWADEAAAATPVLRAGRELLGGVAVTVATGNHDVAHHSDDTRGPTPFGAAFGPGCALLDGRHAGAVLHGPGGYSSWRVLTLPDGGELGVLALGAIFAGLIWYGPFFGSHEGIHEFFGHSIAMLPGNDTLENAHEHLGWLTKLAPFLAMMVGFVLAWIFYIWKPETPAKLAANQPIAYRFLLNKWYFDEIYDAVFVRPALAIGRFLWKRGDGRTIDGFLNGLALGVMPMLNRAYARAQSGYLYTYAFAMVLGIAALVTYVTLTGGAH